MKKTFLLLTGPLVFACASLSAQTTYLSEDFQIGSLPAGWAANPASGAWGVPGLTSSGFTPPAHTIYAGINDDASQTSANASSEIVSPVVNLSAASTVFLKYDLFYGGLTYSSVTETADLDYSTDGGATWTSYGALTTSASWQTVAINMSAQLHNQSNVKIKWVYHDNGGWLYGAALDNVSLFTPAANDAQIMSLNPSTGSPASYGTVASNITFTGTIQNSGLSPITSMALKYNDGTTTYTDNVTSINVASFGTYNFTHTTNYSIPSSGPHPIKFWVELTGDNNHTNDTLNTVITGVAFLPVHAVTVEEATGTWCGWCVRGIVFLDSMNAVHPTTCNLIAVHNGDPMVVTAYDAGVGTLIAGYPSILVNRDIVDDPSNIFPEYNNTISDFGYADLVPTVTYNGSTRVATVSVAAHFAVDLSGDYRLACVFTEAGVHSTAGGQWDQHDYYSTQSQNIPLVDAETGFDFQSAPQVIPSAQMYYGYVSRTILGGFNGQTASLPTTIPSGSTQNYTFTYTIPAAYNVANMKVIVLLINNNQSPTHIMNSAGAAIPLGIDAPSVIGSVDVFPNPMNENSNLNINLIKSENVTVNVYDMAGALVSTENEGVLVEGNHMVALNAKNLANGMYFVKVTAGSSVETIKVTVAH